MHPRVNLHQVAFVRESTAAFIGYCREIGVPNMTLVTPLLMQPGGVEEAQAALAAGGPRAAVVNHPIAMGSSLDRVGDEESEKLLKAIDIAATLGAPVIYLVSGGRGSLLWEAAAERFAELVAPCLPAASEKGVLLTVESASPLNADMHIAHTLDDTVRLAEIAGIGVCIELNACWYEADLKEKFRRAMPLTGLVQVCDYVLGDRFTPNRAVVGDGVVPIEWLLGTILELGYTGVFDLELIGPRIEQEGPRAASKRAAENLSEILTKLGA
ncbi:sugar phosphate isomerase/epimerase [Novosphingobium sp. G106]|uniref:sugar phosphate isomerase/epimerase family protein n=1 Tax=Novosphingobium sp. G106 TaxID=2849500 RepID=UPI001C2D1B0F|nr:TIM barrel protein [Novosphingobium sp. G106]MBV1690641.1 sugar phosphate isomerase/epimerase [Novosphingobium sp. G106]